MTTRCIIVMGVAGSGKTTLARALAAHLSRPFIEGDEFHSAANKAKMAAGQPLTNADREGWIAALTEAVRAKTETCIVACSALNPTVRGWIETGLGHAPGYILLHGTPDLLRERLASRHGHFFDPALLTSQLAALDPPATAIKIDIALSTDDQLRRALAALDEQR